MSQELISQVLERTCQGCGAVRKWEMIGLTEETILDMQNWYSVIREIWVDGQFQKIMVQACSLACVPAAAVKLALPKMAEEPADEIDLASLRTQNLAN